LFQAIKATLLLTRSDFLNVSFLLMLIFIISRGFNFVWTLPEFDSWSTTIGLAGHAFFCQHEFDSYAFYFLSGKAGIS